jgi:hypothetical protein
MSPPPDHKIEQIEVETSEDQEPSENPLAGALNVAISVPETIEIKMVDASVLSDYEVWFFVSSILSSAVIGFLVAYLQGKEIAFLAMTGVLFVIFLVFLKMTFEKRNTLRKKSKIITLRATQVVGIKNK